MKTGIDDLAEYLKVNSLSVEDIARVLKSFYGTIAERYYDKGYAAKTMDQRKISFLALRRRMKEQEEEAIKLEQIGDEEAIPTV